MRRHGPKTLAELAAADVTYQEVGATRHDPMPAGYRHVRRDAIVGTGPAAFERAVEALFGWRMHERAGMTVISRAQRPVPGLTVVLRAGWSLLRLTAACRVVYVVDEANRRGFAYGTLPGHPEHGEEAFTVMLSETGAVRLRIRAFSRPTSHLARASGPFAKLVQDHVTDRYVGSLRQLSSDDVDR